jgi:hypothetical protein
MDRKPDSIKTMILLSSHLIVDKCDAPLFFLIAGQTSTCCSCVQRTEDALHCCSDDGAHQLLKFQPNLDCFSRWVLIFKIVVSEILDASALFQDWYEGIQCIVLVLQQPACILQLQSSCWYANSMHRFWVTGSGRKLGSKQLIWGTVLPWFASLFSLYPYSIHTRM